MSQLFREVVPCITIRKLMEDCLWKHCHCVVCKRKWYTSCRLLIFCCCVPTRFFLRGFHSVPVGEKCLIKISSDSVFQTSILHMWRGRFVFLTKSNQFYLLQWFAHTTALTLLRNDLVNITALWWDFFKMAAKTRQKKTKTQLSI